MIYTVRSDKAPELSLIENDVIRSILQNLYILVTTVKGTVPMYRRFGINSDFIDKPIPVAQTLMISEVKETVDEFEPRAKVKRLSFENDLGTPGRLITVLEVEI